MIDAAKVEAIKDSVDLIDVAAGYTKLSKKTRNERCGPCPRCGGRDRFFVRTEYWGCRGCEITGDVVDLVRFVDRCDFITALEKLSGESLREDTEDDGGDNVTSKGSSKREKRDDRSNVWQSAIWQKNAAAIIKQTTDALERDAGAASRAYLEQRGITQDTWRMWLLGYTTKGGPAISMPYLHPWEAETIFAVRYRRITPRTPEQRYWHERDSFCLLHGLHLIDLNAHTLVVVEGEINAVSIWQDARDLGLSVVSIGSQYVSKATLKAVGDLSTRFTRCLVWCDDPKRALCVQNALKVRDVLAVKSPEIDGAKIDANDMLQQGLLRAFIERKLAARVPASELLGPNGEVLTLEEFERRYPDAVDLCPDEEHRR